MQELSAANAPTANLFTGQGLREFFARTVLASAKPIIRHMLPDALGSVKPSA